MFCRCVAFEVHRRTSVFCLPRFCPEHALRPLPGQPKDKTELSAWRRARRRATFQGIFLAAIVVYVFYFVFSIRQSTDALSLVGHGPAAEPLRRLLMPPWLYLRGVLMVLVTSSRPTFILGHAYPHGVWFYYPTVFMLKSPLGFLGLLVMALVVAIVMLWKRRRELHDSDYSHRVRNSLACAVGIAFGVHGFLHDQSPGYEYPPLHNSHCVAHLDVVASAPNDWTIAADFLEFSEARHGDNGNADSELFPCCHTRVSFLFPVHQLTELRSSGAIPW